MDSKSPTNTSAPVHRSGSSETLPQYTPGAENRRSSLEQDAAPLHVDRDSTPPPIAGPSSKRGFLGKLKDKMVVSKADLEAERQRKELEKQQYLARVAKRREEVDAEIQKTGGANFTVGPRLDENVAMALVGAGVIP
ncbi:hypothetical protein MSAN_02341600 [Mycena sanguinolenta]|uniref:Uncharacterized protein n=1 Tax=Mycena sanguinolenta TaxID=230812 RepID=A0A8H7CH70_9AGAR|nr:hypothetical protein MSAN_02341600 [Mycena sanguinolenta]